MITLRHYTQCDTSDLALFDAQAITDDLVLVVHLPVRVPYIFHANWIPDLTRDTDTSPHRCKPEKFTESSCGCLLRP
ncbi:MAG: Retinal pigment epithelial rane protein [Actinomycetota bacterium]